MIRSAAVLFRERGVDGTSFSDVLAHSGAPRGSIYHHFRGGKTQLAEEATRWAGQAIADRTAAALDEHEPAEAVSAFVSDWCRLLQRTDYTAGCTIAAAALEGAREPSVRDAAAEAFDTWEASLRDALRHRGVAAQRAGSLATLIVSAIEGAIILSRARQCVQPLEQVGRELEAVIVGVLGEAGGG